MKKNYTKLLDLIKQTVDCMEYEVNNEEKKLEISYRPDLAYNTILNFMDYDLKDKDFIDFDRGYTEKQTFSTDNELIIRLMLENAHMVAVSQNEMYEKEKLVTFGILLNELQSSEFKSYKLLVEECIIASEDQESRFVITTKFDDEEKQGIFKDISEYIYKKEYESLI